jgi:hypothetical protein
VVPRLSHSGRSHQCDRRALIWSPRSNITLYGDTADATAANALGVEIALGTDWMPTGPMNLRRELKCADSFDTVNGEFKVTSGADSLIIDDFLLTFTNPPLDQSYNSITGIMNLRNSASKLEPRSAADLAQGATFVTITSSSTGLVVVSGGVTIADGQSAATVQLTGVNPNRNCGADQHDRGNS